MKIKNKKERVYRNQQTQNEITLIYTNKYTRTDGNPCYC